MAQLRTITDSVLAAAPEHTSEKDIKALADKEAGVLAKLTTNQTPKRFAAGGNLPKDSPTRQHNSRLPCVKPFNFGTWTA
jgi:hypothetical protein